MDYEKLLLFLKYFLAVAASVGAALYVSLGPVLYFILSLGIAFGLSFAGVLRISIYADINHTKGEPPITLGTLCLFALCCVVVAFNVETIVSIIASFGFFIGVFAAYAIWAITFACEQTKK